MIGRIVGPAFAPVAACASFGVALKMAVDAINLGEAKAVVVGMTDPPPHPLVISAFYNANVLSADADVSRPLTALKGTHIAGGSCVWIVGDADGADGARVSARSAWRSSASARRPTRITSSRRRKADRSWR